MPLTDGRVLAKGTKISKGTLVGDDEMVALREDPEVTEVRVLSPLTDESEFGISAACYGTSLATGKLIEPGEAVGVADVGVDVDIDVDSFSYDGLFKELERDVDADDKLVRSSAQSFGGGTNCLKKYAKNLIHV